MSKFGLLVMSLFFTACSAQAPLLGGDKDAQGCLPSAGQSWSQLRQECVQVFDIADIRLDDSEHQGSAVYALLAEDKQQAELFAVDIQGSILLEAVKGGYRSADGRYSLQRQADGNWRLRRALP